MYRAVIVDDEPDAREGLQLLLDWERAGFRVVGEAENGAMALEQMPLWRADLVVTDIRMPVLDGIAYIKRMKEQFPDAVMAVVSAYGEFAYAQEALRLGVFDFLLKPLSREELAVLLSKAKAHLDERHSRFIRERETSQLVQERLLQDLCHGKSIAGGDKRMLDNLCVHGADSEFRVLLLEMDDYALDVERYTERELELKRFMIRNISEEIVGRDWGMGYQTYEDAPERIGMLLVADGNSGDEAVCGLCATVVEALKQYVKIPVSVGFGKQHSEWSGIRRSREEALEALNYAKLFEGKGSLLSYTRLEEQLDHQRKAVSALEDWGIGTLLSAVDETDASAVERELNRLLDEMKQRLASPDMFRGLCLEIVMGLFTMIREQDGSAWHIFGQGPETYSQVYAKRSFDELQAWMKELVMNAIRYLTEVRGSKLPDVMQEVRQYVEEHYHEDLSLKSIATKVYKNPVYLGQLFKSTFGESFTQYLTKVRIDKAKEMLRRSNDRVYEIAEKVGYVTLDTFYQKFKQQTGMNPTEYKLKLSEAGK